MLTSLLRCFAIAGSLLGLGLPASACGQCGGDGAADGADRPLLEVAAADALVTIIVRPERWVPLRDALGPHVPERFRVPLANLASPWDLAVLASQGAVSVGALAHLDKQRPVALGLVVAPDDLVVAAGAVATGDGTLGIRHRLILPATDADALAREVRVELARLGLPTLDDETIGAAFAAIFAEGDRVRVELVTHLGFTRVSDRTWRTLWRDRLAARPAAALPSTPGVAQALVPDAPVSVYVQAARLRDAAGPLGGTAVLEALAFADPAMRDELKAVGIAEILTAWSLLAPERAWIGDVGAALTVKGGLRVEATASLTDKGLAALGAATAASRPVPVPAGGFARGQLGLSLGALADAVVMPPVFADAKGSDVAQAFMRCGMLCTFSLESTLAALSRYLLEVGPPRADLPRSLAFALDGSGRPTLSLAVGAADPAPLALARELWSNARRDGTVREDKVDGGALLVFGDGGPDQVAFSATDEGPIASLDVDLGRVGAVIRGDLPLSGRLALRTELVGNALASALCLGPEVSSERCAPSPAATSPAPAPVPATTEASTCLERAIHVLSSAWQDASHVDPEQAPLVLAKARVDAEPSLACAERDAAVRARANAMRALDARLQRR